MNQCSSSFELGSIYHVLNGTGELYYQKSDVYIFYVWLLLLESVRILHNNHGYVLRFTDYLFGFKQCTQLLLGNAWFNKYLASCSIINLHMYVNTCIYLYTYAPTNAAPVSDELSFCYLRNY